MVLLTMTPLMVEALVKLQNIKEARDARPGEEETCTKTGQQPGGLPKESEGEHSPDPAPKEQNPTVGSNSGAPSLSNPAPGNPIAHSQVIEIWRDLKSQSSPSYTLEALLQGSNIYVPPPPPKPEPVSSRSPQDQYQLQAQKNQN